MVLLAERASQLVPQHHNMSEELRLCRVCRVSCSARMIGQLPARLLHLKHQLSGYNLTIQPTMLLPDHSEPTMTAYFKSSLTQAGGSMGLPLYMLCLPVTFLALYRQTMPYARLSRPICKTNGRTSRFVVRLTYNQEPPWRPAME
jgi:hypothetical protein